MDVVVDMVQIGLELLVHHVHLFLHPGYVLCLELVNTHQKIHFRDYCGFLLG